MLQVTGTSAANNCFNGGMMGGVGLGSIYSIIVSLLILALLVGFVALVGIWIYKEWNSISKK
jgi:predicted lipid-binding transport protein (Tim44 family)